MKLEKPLIILYLFLGITLFIFGGNDYRHASNFLSNVVLVFPSELVRTSILAIIAVKVCHPNFNPFATRRNYLLVIFLLGSLLGSTGSYMVVQSLVVCFSLYFFEQSFEIKITCARSRFDLCNGSGNIHRICK